MRVLFVHGALVKDADWWWHRMPGQLQRLGHTTAAVELPSCVGPGDLTADAEAVRAAMAAADGPVALVGHSYGGTVLTEAGAGADHLVYVASVLAEEGRSHASYSVGGPAPWVREVAGGRLELTPTGLRELFFADCDDRTFRDARRRTARQDARALNQPVGTPAWRTVPTTYLVCAADRAIPAAEQRESAAAAGTVVELPTGHHPFLSRPELFAEAVHAAVTGRR